MKKFSVKCESEEETDAVECKLNGDGYRRCISTMIYDRCTPFFFIAYSDGDYGAYNHSGCHEVIKAKDYLGCATKSTPLLDLHHTAIMPRKIYPTTPHPTTLSDLSNIRSCDKAHNKMVSCSGDCENCIFTDGWESFKADKVVER